MPSAPSLGVDPVISEVSGINWRRRKKIVSPMGVHLLPETMTNAGSWMPLRVPW